MPEALDLISKLLRWDPAHRLSAAEAMAHPYFAPVRQAEAQDAARAEALEAPAAEAAPAAHHADAEPFAGLPLAGQAVMAI